MLTINVNELENIAVEMIQTEVQREKNSLKNEQNLRGLCDNSKGFNIYVSEVPEREEKERNTKNI